MTAITKIKFKRKELSSLEFKWVVVANDYNYGYVRVPSVAHVVFQYIVWKAPVIHLMMMETVHE